MKTTVTANWTDSLKRGKGEFQSDNPLLNKVPYSFMKRSSGDVTLPEEFLAAAHAACFNMTMAMLLSQKQYTIESLDTACTISYDSDQVTHSELEVSVKVEGLSDDELQAIATEAKQLCPIGQAYSFPSSFKIAAEVAE